MDAHIDDDGSGFHHIGSHETLFADGGNEDVGLPAFIDERRAVAVADDLPQAGASQTCDVDDESFAVRLIPTTRRETNLDALKPGDLVNIETDLVGKYVCEQLRFMDGAQRGGRKLSMDDLTEAGF